ncbi:hypothetical protein A4D02_14755 [Niastella koreensis]|uniref:Uncharacterized protein n=1 Tax=Niastella koreensis TaxID=354356 RepID=A0ABX3NMV9_9BACT|nr:hypothetical protein [Niastella koreensis]OQP40187.1 hypothetical protein A4D02_14755 [Niastella koreensis]
MQGKPFSYAAERLRFYPHEGGNIILGNTLLQIGMGLQQFLITLFVRIDTPSYDSKLFEHFVSLINEKGNSIHKVDDYADALVTSRQMYARL